MAAVLARGVTADPALGSSAEARRPARPDRRAVETSGSRTHRPQRADAQYSLRGPAHEMHPLATPCGQPHWSDHRGARHPGHRQEYAGVCLCMGLRLRFSRRPVLIVAADACTWRRRDPLAETKGVALMTRSDSGPPSPGQSEGGVRGRPGQPRHRQVRRSCSPTTHVRNGPCRRQSHPRTGNRPGLADDLPRIRACRSTPSRPRTPWGCCNFPPIGDRPQDDEWKAALGDRAASGR